MTENVHLTIGDVVARTGVPPTTIHYYRRCGLLPPLVGGTADRLTYDDTHVTAIKLIRQLREERRLSLKVIAGMLPDLLARGSDGQLTADDWDTALASHRAPGEETRDRLLDAAIEVFGARGYAEVSVGDIAEHAGVAKGSVYRYFASKRDLYFACIDKAVTGVLERFGAAVVSHGGPIDAKVAASMLMQPVQPVLALLLELGARSLQDHPGHLEEAQVVLRRLIDGAGALVDTDESVRERGAAVVQALIVDSFRAVLPPPI
jgi:AcrR family transcriptional regulator